MTVKLARCCELSRLKTHAVEVNFWSWSEWHLPHTKGISLIYGMQWCAADATGMRSGGTKSLILLLELGNLS